MVRKQEGGAVKIQAIEDLMLRFNDSRWPDFQARIYEIAEEQYRLGFLDGEASATRNMQHAAGAFNATSSRGAVVDHEEPQEIGGVCV